MSILFEVYRYYGVTIMRSLAYGRTAVATMKCYLVETVFEAYHLVAGQGATVGATYVRYFLLTVEHRAQVALGLVGNHMVEPVGARLYVLVGANLYTVAATKHSLYRA